MEREQIYWECKMIVLIIWKYGFIKEKEQKTTLGLKDTGKVEGDREIKE